MTDLLLSITLLVAVHSPTSMPADTLADLKWKNRILVVLYEDSSDPRVNEQFNEWKSDEAGARDRDLVLIRVPQSGSGLLGVTRLSPESTSQIYDRLSKPGENLSVVLVGKDGTEKRRWRRPVALTEVFELIDAMPMRRREMRTRAGGSPR